MGQISMRDRAGGKMVSRSEWIHYDCFLIRRNAWMFNAG